MASEYFLKSSVLCLILFLFNIFKIGLKGKSSFIPSTLFAVTWGLSCLGMYYYTSGILEGVRILRYGSKIPYIAEFQYYVLIAILLGFICARFVGRRIQFDDTISSSFFNNLKIVLKRTKWILYIYGTLGFILLSWSISLYGLDYNAIRVGYVENKASMGFIWINLTRICYYLSAISTFLYALLGIKHGMDRINNKEIFEYFILGSLFLISQGGRLYILSFFVPYFCMFFVIRMLNYNTFFRRGERKSLFMWIILPVFLIVFIQSLKTDKATNYAELFYASSSYIHLNELFKSIPHDYELGYGKYSIPFIPVDRSMYTDLIKKWVNNNNPAGVCVPSYLADLYLDFGYVGSIVMAFFIFFFIELYAFRMLRSFSLNHFFIYLILCKFSFSAASSSVNVALKGALVSLVFLYLLNKMLLRNSN